MPIAPKSRAGSPARRRGGGGRGLSGTLVSRRIKSTTIPWPSTIFLSPPPFYPRFVVCLLLSSLRDTSDTFSYSTESTNFTSRNALMQLRGRERPRAQSPGPPAGNVESNDGAVRSVRPGDCFARNNSGERPDFSLANL